MKEELKTILTQLKNSTTLATKMGTTVPNKKISVGALRVDLEKDTDFGSIYPAIRLFLIGYSFLPVPVNAKELIIQCSIFSRVSELEASEIGKIVIDTLNYKDFLDSGVKINRIRQNNLNIVYDTNYRVWNYNIDFNVWSYNNN